MEPQANTTHEPSLSESVPHEPPIETERKPLQPGKWYGIIALLCGAEGLLAILALLLIYLLFSLGITPQDMGMWHRLTIILPILFFTNPFCVIAGIIFGIRGRNTEGRVYAYTGLVLSVLCGLTVTPFALLMAYNLLVPCC